MEKYFVPKLEDLREGYVYEYQEYDEEIDNYIDKWNKSIFDSRNGLGHDLEHTFREGKVRVPYLSKEQIEAEGWIPITEGNIDQWYRDDKHLALKLYYNLGPKQDKIIIRIWQEISHGNQLFLGECKCINTFRYICKLIGI